MNQNNPQNGNILKLLPSQKNHTNGVSLPTGQTVSVAFCYTDADGQPLANQRLHWRIESGSAIIERGSTITDVAGIARNRIFRTEKEIDGSFETLSHALAKLVVWPHTDPKNRIETTLHSGDSDDHPTWTVLPNGNILAIVSRRNGYASNWRASNSTQGLIYTAYYCDPDGNPLEGQAIQFTPDRGTLGPDWPSSQPMTNKAGVARAGFIHYSNGSPGESLSCTVQLPGSTYTAQVSNPIVDLSNSRTMQANMVWPLDPSTKHVINTWVDVKVHLVDNNGAAYTGNPNVSWTVTQGDAQFEHDTTGFDENGIASNRIKSSTPGQVVAQIAFAYQSSDVLWAYPTFTFITDGEITITSPKTGGKLPSNTKLNFQARYIGKDGNGLSNQLVNWSTSASEAVFSPAQSRTNEDGYAASQLTVVTATGSDISVEVSATSDANPNNKDARTYRFIDHPDWTVLPNGNILAIVSRRAGVGSSYLSSDPIYPGGMVYTAYYCDQAGKPLGGQAIQFTPDRGTIAQNWPTTRPTTNSSGIAQVGFNNYYNGSPGESLSCTAQVPGMSESAQTTNPLYSQAVANTLQVNMVWPLDPTVTHAINTWVDVTVHLAGVSGTSVSAGMTVDWTVQQGSAEFESETSLSDANGLATNRIRASTPGKVAARISWDKNRSDLLPAYPSFTFVAGDRNTLTITRPDPDQVQPANTPVDFQARYLGPNGSGLPNQLIDWSTSTSRASFTPPQSRTDGNGYASSQLNTLVSAGNELSVNVTATAVSNPQDKDTKSFRFADGKSALSITAPDPSVLQTANTQVEFRASYSRGEGKKINWSVLTGNATFDPPFSVTNQFGIATSKLKTVGVTQGQRIAVTVQAQADAVADDKDSKTYYFGADVLLITQPDDPSKTQPVGKQVDLQALYRDANSGAIPGKALQWSTSPAGNYLTVPTSNTDPNGYASNSIRVDTPMSLDLTVAAVDVPADTRTVRLKFDNTTPTYTYTLTIDSPKAGDILPYDTLVPVHVTLSSTNGGPVGGQTLTWTGGFSASTTQTNPDGTSVNYIIVETTGGFPAAPTDRFVQVSANSLQASDSRHLTFNTPGTGNTLAFLAPSDKDQLPVNEWVTAKVKLINAVNDPLGQYQVNWSGESGILFDPTPAVSETLSDGTATIRLKLQTSGPDGQTFSKTVFATAYQAEASNSRTLQFSSLKVDPVGVVADKYYAQNPPNGQNVDPTNGDQIITVTATVTDEYGNVQPNVQVNWTWEYNVPGPKFFNEKNEPLSPDASRRMPMTTGPDGNAVIKVGSTIPFKGQVSALVNGYSHSVGVVIATMDSSKAVYNPPYIVDGNRLIIPSHGSPTFNVKVTDGSVSDFPTIVMWLKGKNQRQTVISSSGSDAKDFGFDIPYSLLDVNNPNVLAYWAVNERTGNMAPSNAQVFTATGNRDAHPDYSNTDRKLPEPYLDGHVTVVNSKNIVGGLKLFIPSFNGWNSGDVITAYAYLNAYEPTSPYAAKPMVLSVDYEMMAGRDFVNGAPVVVSFNEEDLAGYASYRGQIPGEFEADYQIAKGREQTPYGWSVILEGVTLDTMPPT